VRNVLLLRFLIFSTLGCFFCGILNTPAYAVQTTPEQATISALTSTTPTQTPVLPPDQSINLTLSPVTLQLDTKPGDESTAEIRIRNNSTQIEPLKVSFATFNFNDRTQQVDLNQNDTGEHMEWISVDRETLSVNPSEWETVKVRFSPPESGALSYYYAVIFSRESQQNPEDATTAITGAPAVLVLTNVDSPLAKRELQVDSFSVPKFWIEFLPQTFILRIKNTGNTHVKPLGNIFIDGQGKKDLAVLSVNEKNSLVLPNTARDFTISWDDGFPVHKDKTDKDQVVKDEEGQVVRELKWDFSQVDRFRIGKYTAHLLLVYDNGERDIPIESFVSFWVIPWRICLATLVVLLFVLIGVRSSLVSLVKSLRKKP